MRRRIVLLFAVVAATVFAFPLFACDKGDGQTQNGDTDTYYTVTVEQPAGGGISLFPFSSNGKYKEGTSLKVTCIPANNYQFGSLSVNQLPVTGSEHTFLVNQDTTIAATFFPVKNSNIGDLYARVEKALKNSVQGERDERTEGVRIRADFEIEQGGAVYQGNLEGNLAFSGTSTQFILEVQSVQEDFLLTMRYTDGAEQATIAGQATGFGNFDFKAMTVAQMKALFADENPPEEGEPGIGIVEALQLLQYFKYIYDVDNATAYAECYFKFNDILALIVEAASQVDPTGPITTDLLKMLPLMNIGCKFQFAENEAGEESISAIGLIVDKKQSVLQLPGGIMIESTEEQITALMHFEISFYPQETE